MYKTLIRNNLYLFCFRPWSLGSEHKNFPEPTISDGLLEVFCVYSSFHIAQMQVSKRAIFQTFWKTYNCTVFSFFEIETSNFGCSYVFSSPLKWWGRIWPNLTFWTQKRYISGKTKDTNFGIMVPGFHLGLYSVIHISIPPIKELCSKMALGEVGVSLPW